MRKLALHWRILIGLALGALVGITMSFLGYSQETAFWLKPFGTIFLNLLKLTAVPLVFVSLINGISSMSDTSKLSKIGTRTIGIYVTTTILAVSIGLTLVNMLRPGDSFSEQAKADFSAKFAATAAKTTESAEALQQMHPLQALIDIFPSNVFASFSNNMNMLQVIFVATLVGIAMVMMSQERTRPLRELLSSVDEVILKIVGMIMGYAPFGVFALLASIIADFAGNDPAKASELLYSLGIYSGTVILGLLMMVLLVYPIALKVFSRFDYTRFIRGIFPAQVMAFSTSSSNATLPVTMRQVEKGLGVSEETASFVLPLGATVNMDGTSLYQGVASVFIAQVYGIDLTIGQQIMIVLTATMASIGTPGIPGAGIVTLIVILEQVGIPVEGIALILAPDRLLDMFRTVVNITGDAFTCVMVERSLDEHSLEQEPVITEEDNL